MQKRSAGVLLHISSLPAPYGIGDLGPAARAFAAALSEAGIVWWQFLPLSPTSEFIGNSPYSSPSAFAGNPLFISPELLCGEGCVSYADVECVPGGAALAEGPVDYHAVTAHRATLLNAAFTRLKPHLPGGAAFQAFCGEHAGWLDDYALFTAIKAELGGAIWTDWPDPLKWRDPGALEDFSRAYAGQVLRQKFIQYLFFSQLAELRERCRELGVRLIGDLPIYVTHDSADVWAAPGLFNLDEGGRPVTVAGVPPDYFSATGQLWGNPVYNWKRMAQDGFAWWKKRIRHNLLMADVLRLDHFRGFVGFWEVPAGEETAVKGEWRAGPGAAFFRALTDEFDGAVPIIAEDLGVITDDVREIMEEFHFPGMKVLHFGFGGASPWNNPDAPFRCTPRSVAYTGTHDNTTSLDWFASVPEEERNNFCGYVGRAVQPGEAPEAMIRLALESASNTAIIPMQDILGLGAEARMNTPSVAKGNWTWRMPGSARDLGGLFKRFRELCRIYGRIRETDETMKQEDGENNA